MVTPDLRRRAAPVVAQGVAFVAVLVIGALVASSPKSGPLPPPKVPSSPVAVQKFMVAVQATANVPLAGRHVTVLRDGTLASAASGALSNEDIFIAWVPKGSYQVCLSVPAGLEVAGGSPSGLACSAAQVPGAGTVFVAFVLVKAAR
ncbi:MAG TPA: hypothetical protein VGS06_40975 [Streptosporangiaceae bacterium]|nr:hypothetical protein [Streptosporangiaceae bacterium]